MRSLPSHSVLHRHRQEMGIPSFSCSCCVSAYVSVSVELAPSRVRASRQDTEKDLMRLPSQWQGSPVREKGGSGLWPWGFGKQGKASIS